MSCCRCAHALNRDICLTTYQGVDRWMVDNIDRYLDEGCRCPDSQDGYQRPDNKYNDRIGS